MQQFQKEISYDTKWEYRIEHIIYTSYSLQPILLLQTTFQLPKLQIEGLIQENNTKPNYMTNLVNFNDTSISTGKSLTYNKYMCMQRYS